MLFQVQREFKDQMINIPVRTRSKERLVCRVLHYNKPHTVYFDTAPLIEGVEAFRVKIPKMPEAANIELYNEKFGNVRGDVSYQVGRITSSPIKMMITGILDRTVNAFARFSDDFAENAGIMSAQNSVYVSPDGRFQIHYKDTIRDDSGKALRTPARINAKTGIIEISKRYYINYTVPARKAINWHEFSHIFRNVNKADELEADKNAIMIYLATGNPTVEAYNVFLKVFNNTPSDLNRARYNELNSFIKKFHETMNKQLR